MVGEIQKFRLFQFEAMLLLLFKKKNPYFCVKNAALYNLHNISFASSTEALAPKLSPLAEYLISSFGFSPQKADSATKLVPKDTTIDHARSVSHFLKHLGLTDATILKLISNYPRVLCADVDKTLRPNFNSLLSVGFAEPHLHLLIASNPIVLISPLAIPRLRFWQSFLRPTDNENFVSFLRNRGLLFLNITSGVTPKIETLKAYGIPESHIVDLVSKGRGFITRGVESIERLLKRTEDLGLDPRTPKFILGLVCLSNAGEAKLEAKVEFFKGFGWSKEEFLAAFRKFPQFINLSEGNVRMKMEFLVGTAGCEQSYIAANPKLLALSLVKRLKPRYYVLQVLRSSKVIVRGRGVASIMSLSEANFLNKCILCYKEQLPDLHGAYIAAKKIPGP